MTRTIAHLLRGVAVLFAVAVTSAGADVVPATDIVTLAPSTVNGPFPCNTQGETTLDQIITAGASRIPYFIPDGQVFVITGLSWFRTGLAAATTHPGILAGPGVAICAMERTAAGNSEAGLQVRVYGYFTKAKLPASAPRR